MGGSVLCHVTQLERLASLASDTTMYIYNYIYCAQLTELDIQEFRSILSSPGGDEGGGGGERVVTDPATIAPHNVDWLHNLRGQSRLLLRPRTTQEVSRILAHCNTRRYRVHPKKNTPLLPHVPRVPRLEGFYRIYIYIYIYMYSPL